MQVEQGFSVNADPALAVAEATRSFRRVQDPDVVFAFASTKQDPDATAQELARRFPRSLIVGCTTAGEHVADRHFTGSLVVAAVSSPEVRWTAAAARDVEHFDEASAQTLSDTLLRQLGVNREDLDPARHFSLCFIDGLSAKEEVLAALVAEALDGIPLLGGSAGDDLAFKETRIFFGGEALKNGAVFVLGESSVPFEVIKHQHFTTTPRSLVITKADVAARRVSEMDGYPALEAYARALGKKPEAITSEVTFMNPVTFVCNGEIYVRSIQRVEPDGSLIFYCGIEEGMVLSIGGHEEMAAALDREVQSLASKMGGADLFVAFNCILRALEATQLGVHGDLGRSLSGLSKNVIGFDTYGEQLSGLHINQTLVGIAFLGAQNSSASGEKAGA